MLASDDRLLSASLGRGRWRFLSHPCAVKILCAVSYCETYWFTILSYMLEYVDGTNVLDENKLQEGYRKFYHAIKL